MASDVGTGSAASDVPAVVVGGIEWHPDVNHLSIHTVRELARTRPVLYIYTEGRGGVRERLRALGRDPARLVRTAFAVDPRQATDNLWLASIQGLSTLAPLAFPEPVRRYNLCLCRQ